jgi:hypothetical protein
MLRQPSTSHNPTRALAAHSASEAVGGFKIKLAPIKDEAERTFGHNTPRVPVYAACVCHNRALESDETVVRSDVG